MKCISRRGNTQVKAKRQEKWRKYEGSSKQTAEGRERSHGGVVLKNTTKLMGVKVMTTLHLRMRNLALALRESKEDSEQGTDVF